MAAEGKFIDISAFAAQVENTDLFVINVNNHARGVASKRTRQRWKCTYLRVGHTTVVARFRVGLVLAVAVATSGTATHLGL